MSNRDLKYDNYSDLFEYGNISDEETIKLCNKIIEESKIEKDNVVLESMYNAIVTATVYRNIAGKIETDNMLIIIESCGKQVAEYIAQILAYTGNCKYFDVIKYIGSIYENIDIESMLVELNAIAKKI